MKKIRMAIWGASGVLVGTTAGALSSNVRINQALAGETYTLKYYDSDKTTELPFNVRSAK